MLVIVAGTYDPEARALCRRWGAHDAALLTARDLSRPGWCFNVGAADRSTAVVANRPVAAGAIRGVLVRWPGIHPDELVQIAAGDREYVAAEMNAFLVAWLAELSCPVLNRPSPLNLLGPAWSGEQWIWTAARLGIRVRSRRLAARRGAVAKEDGRDLVTVSVVGRRTVGDVPELLRLSARRLADAAGVELLNARFSGRQETAELVGVDLWPEVADEQVADAVLSHFLEFRGSDSALR